MNADMSKPETDNGLWLVYDGDCPLCRASAHAVRVKKTVGQLHMLDARTNRDHPLMTQIAAEGLDLNEGMVVRFEGRLYHGMEALHILALLGSEHDAFNRLSAWIFKSKTRTRVLYPVMKLARRISLKILGKDLL